jgi:hypothetical protein
VVDRHPTLLHQFFDMAMLVQPMVQRKIIPEIVHA